MSDDLFRRNRPFDQLDGFYTEWSEHLTERRLTPLRYFPSGATNDAVLVDIRLYYDTLDHYANRDTILYFLFPSSRCNSLETLILFLGDIHPRLFTGLIQSFINDDQDPIQTFSNLAESWEEVSSELGNTINETASRLVGEMREAQDLFIRCFSDKWVSSSFLHSQSGTVVMETATSVTTDQDGGGAMIMEELVRIFRQANQLRKDTITRIVEVLDMNQTALFLESVCKILAGFKHQDQAFQNSLLGNHLIDQQLPEHEQLLNPLDPSGEVNAHHNYPPRPRMQQHAPQLPPHADQLFQPFAARPLNPHPPGMQQHAPQLPPYADQLFQPFAARPLNPHPPMMQQHAPQRPPHGHQLFPPFPPPGLVIAHHNFHPHMMQQYAPLRPPPGMNQQHQQHHVLYVGNLAPEATADLLLQGFSRYRSVRDSKICVHKGNGSTYGFVSFADEREYLHAMEAMNRQIFLGWPMHIGHAAKNNI